MNEEQGADQLQGKGEVQEEAVQPQTEQPTGDDQESMPNSNQEAEEVSEEDAIANAKNPERTKAYIERLKAEKAELERQQQGSPLDLFQTPDAGQYENLSQEQVEDIAENFADEDGYVDESKLRQALNKANESANQALQYAQSVEQRLQDSEKHRQEQETYNAFPQLNNNSPEFDDKFARLVRDRMVSQYTTSGSYNFLQAAKEIAQDVYDPTNKKKEVPKQGPVEQGRGQDRQQVKEQELQGRSDDAAIAERLAKKGVQFFKE